MTTPEVRMKGSVYMRRRLKEYFEQVERTSFQTRALQKRVGKVFVRPQGVAHMMAEAVECGYLRIVGMKRRRRVYAFTDEGVRFVQEDAADG